MLSLDPNSSMEDIVITRDGLSTRGATNALLSVICALLALQLVSSHARALGPRWLMAESAHPASTSADAPQPVYLVSGPAGERLDMLPVRLVYLDKTGSLDGVVNSDGLLRVRVSP